MTALPLRAHRGLYVCIAAFAWSSAAWVPNVAAAFAASSNAFEAPTAPAAAGGPVLGSDDHLREAIRGGYERSATFRALVDHLVDHHTIVRVHWAPALTGNLSACLLHRVAVAPDGGRLLWVLVRHNEPSDSLVALLAHELQHVHEALDAGVSSGEEMARVFELLGERSGSHGRTRNFAVYDTRAAVGIQRLVARELRGTPPPGLSAR